MTSIKEAMESAGYEEIDALDYSNGRIKLYECNGDGYNVVSYFKKKPEPKFPKVFEDDWYCIEVDKGLVVINTLQPNHKHLGFAVTKSLPLLIEAIKYWEANKDD